jgi:hypothetical protein
LIVLLLYGCNNDLESDINQVETSEIRSPIDDPVNITIEEANKIALSQAELDGLDSPALWSERETEIGFGYSVKYDRDMKVYIVHIKTAARPNDIMFDAFYFVSTESGEIIITND